MQESTQPQSLNKSSRGPWIRAFRPKILTASFAPIPIGTALAYIHGATMDWIIPLSALFSAMCIQTGMNLVNDALDFTKGADTKERMGDVRLVQSGILTSNQVLAMGLAFFLLALIFGIPLMVKGGIPLVVILLVSCLCGYCYTGGPWPLSYLGVAEFFIVFFYGLVLTSSVYYLLTGVLGWASMVAGLQIGFLATIMLAIGNFRDRVGDAKANKRTLAVRFGQTFARWEITSLALAPFLLGIYWLTTGDVLAAVLPFLALPIALIVIKGIWTHEPSPALNKFHGLSALLHLSFGLLLALGLCL